MLKIEKGKKDANFTMQNVQKKEKWKRKEREGKVKTIRKRKNNRLLKFIQKKYFQVNTIVCFGKQIYKLEKFQKFLDKIQQIS